MKHKSLKSRITLTIRDYECLPNYRVSWWEDNVPQLRSFLMLSAAKRFLASLKRN